MLIVIAVYVVDSGSEQTVEQLLNCGLMSLVSENQRPSIRMLAEWMLIILSTSFRQIAIPIIESAFEKATTSRLSSVPAFLSVFTQLSLVDKSTGSLETTMKRVVPWSMAQHCGTRLTAQVIVLNIQLILKHPKNKRLANNFRQWLR